MLLNAIVVRFAFDFLISLSLVKPQQTLCQYFSLQMPLFGKLIGNGYVHDNHFWSEELI